MSKIRVEIHAVIEVDTDQWRLIDPMDNPDPDHDPTTASETEIGWVVRNLWPIDDHLPRWARDAVRVVEER